MSDKYILIIIFTIVFIQASWIFYDASKRGDNKWLWGLFGMLHVPASLIIYLLLTRMLIKEITCPHCLYNIKKDSKYCSYCGEKIDQE